MAARFATWRPGTSAPSRCLQSPTKAMDMLRNPDQRTILATLRAHGFPEPDVEHRFHPTRKWRFDFAWPTARVALEKEGGLYQGSGSRCSCCRQPLGGAHRSVSGILRDIEKYNAAQSLAWHVIRQAPDKLLLLSSLKLLAGMLHMRGLEFTFFDHPQRRISDPA